MPIFLHFLNTYVYKSVLAPLGAMFIISSASLESVCKSSASAFASLLFDASRSAACTSSLAFSRASTNKINNKYFYTKKTSFHLYADLNN